ncbi:hypothetical protein MSSIH_1175 [Methanosarcina siciliae HI350]|uniref:ScoMcrA-like SRA domain-containing protein n=1 Tax=Methanosarcina siciliae HI350 TaxID=1434119 RepID=A0A0E3PDR2_9EURY|nr:hypothetical protein [Methanosarcina siciliae]AKB31865.1 hypothetical protein MSSIH_1175 [Methanosarcina siciliae HI350]
MTLNKEYTKEEIETIFSTNFGYGIKGITLRKYKNGNLYIILFSKENGPYSDEFGENAFYYDGEGVNKDQKLTAANKALIDAKDDHRLIYGFRQEGKKGIWRYIGTLKVLNYKYVSKNGHMTYVFKLENSYEIVS